MVKVLKEGSAERIANALNVLDLFEKGSRLYWIDVLVNKGDLSKGEAGFIIRGLNKAEKVLA